MSGLRHRPDHSSAEQLGTGHAVSLALAQVPDDSITLVLYGDVPLTSPRTLQRCVDAAQQSELGVVTANVADPAELGRIVRDDRGGIQAIVEYRDATASQRAISEINSGILAAPTSMLRAWLKSLNTDNSQGEYYLTDVIAMAVADQVPVTGIVADDEAEVLGVNDRAQLAQAERIFQRRVTQELMRAGVTFADPDRVDIRGSLTCGTDCFIDVNTVFVGDVTLANNVVVGPGCIIEDSVIGQAVTIHPHTLVEGAEVDANCSLVRSQEFAQAVTSPPGLNLATLLRPKFALAPGSASLPTWVMPASARTPTSAQVP